MEKRQNKLNIARGIKRCTKCLEFKKRTEFHFSKKSRGWLKADCKECRSKENYNPLSNRHTLPLIRRQRELERKRRWYKKTFEERPEMFRKYTAERRARKTNAQGFYTIEDWKQKILYYGNRCIYCYKELDNKNITKDHLIPLSKGGTNWIANLAPACKFCNDSKWTKSVYEYKNTLRSFSEAKAIPCFTRPL